MSERENHRAQRNALRAARDAAATDRRRAHEDALARYLRLQAERPARTRPRKDETATSTTSESE